MNAHVLLNLLNEFNKFNNTGAGMLDSIYHHMMLKSFFNHIFGVETSRFCHPLANIIIILDIIMLRY